MSALPLRRALLAAVVFAGAFLLFLVEPLAAKALLPVFGGSAAVWLSALVFFQVALVAGYLWAHVLATQRTPRGQAVAHLVLLSAAAFSLRSGDPAAVAARMPQLELPLRVLATLAVTIGLPFVALAATAPLVQTFWARAEPGTPYRLYALSNVASLLGLLAYPFVIEPRAGLAAQRAGWSIAFCAFAVACATAAFVSARAPATPAAAPEDAAPLPAVHRLLWFALPFVGSLLLSAVTGHLTLNVAPVPLLWVVPLAAYLLSFVVTFESDRLYRRWFWIPAAGVAIAWVAPRAGQPVHGKHLALEVAATVLAFFACAVLCHGELVRLRPPARRLTPFYVLVAIGGAAGGAFVALLAPQIFRTTLELAIALVLCALVAAAVVWRAPAAALRRRLLLRGVALAGLFGLCRILIANERRIHLASFDLGRSFYSTLRVEDEPVDDGTLRTLVHGTTVHGGQWLDPAREREPTTYYGRDSAVGRALTALHTHRPSLQVGVVGLGAGVLAAYCKSGDTFTFFEIDRLVVRMSTSDFSFVGGCPSHRVVLGDARLSIAARSDRFDLLAVDAFSGDAIPVHLLTVEAFRLYASRLGPDGILAVHVSNRFVDLAPVVAASAAGIGWAALRFDQEGDDDRGLDANTWILVVPRRPLLEQLGFMGLPAGLVPPSGFQPWTDDFSYLAGLLHDDHHADEDEGED